MSGEAVELSTSEHLARVRDNGRTLARALVDASEAGVSYGLLMPQLIMVFREEIGEMPEGFKLPGLPS